MKTTAWALGLVLFALALLGRPSVASAGDPLWVNALNYGAAGGGFYWDPSTNQVWTAERGWHAYAPSGVQPVPLWVNALTYGSKGGGFYFDPATNQVWTAERGWHNYSPGGAATQGPTAVPTSGAIAALARSVPGPSGTGMPGKVDAKIDVSSSLPIFITIDIPDSLFAHFRDTPDAQWAAYGKAILSGVRAQFPSVTGSYIEVSFWTLHDWSGGLPPSFLLGTDFYDCTLNRDYTWFCPYPEFEVRLNLRTGAYEYASVAWKRDPFYRPVP